MALDFAKGLAVLGAAAKAARGARPKKAYAIGMSPNVDPVVLRAIGKATPTTRQLAQVVAPTSSSAIQRGQRFSFGAAPRHAAYSSGMRVSGEQYWCAVGGSGAGISTILTNLSGTSISMLPFDPNDTAFCSPPLTNFGQSFLRYVLRRCKITYIPATSTSTSQSICFAAYTDTSTQIASVNATFQQLQQVTNSVAGPPWAQMELDIPCDGELRFITDSAVSGSIGVAEGRQNHAFFLRGYSQSAYTNTTYGSLRIAYTIDFYEIAGTATEASLMRRLAVVRALIPPQTPPGVGASDSTYVAPVQLVPAEEKKIRSEDEDGVLVTPFSSTPVKGGLVMSGLEPVVVRESVSRGAGLRSTAPLETPFRGTRVV